MSVFPAADIARDTVVEFVDTMPLLINSAAVVLKEGATSTVTLHTGDHSLLLSKASVAFTLQKYVLDANAVLAVYDADSVSVSMTVAVKSESLET
jgi:hypothetical protein